jgi:CDP-diacylglycerol--glycerol-3-phosphate 3-phosphatidyltransferase
MAIFTQRHYRLAPLALTGLRVALGPTVIVLALVWPHPGAFGSCLLAAFLSDVFDGVLARKLGVATAMLRRLDSIADTIFYLAALLAVWILHPEVILENLVLLTVLVGLELARYALDFWKFGREASYHMWTAKLWGIALFLGFFSILVMGNEGLPATLAIAVGIIADVEGLLISMLLPSWHHDVPSVAHAWRIRKYERKAI